MCTDLLTIGDGTVVRKGAFLSCYRAHAGLIETGSVTLGREVVVSEATVLDIETSMGDRAQLGHSSSLHSGQAVPADERWHGSPAQRTEVDYRAVAPTDCGALRRVLYPLSQLLGMVLVSLPLVIGGAVILVTEVPQIPALLDSAHLTPAGLSFYLEALAGSFVLLFGGLLVGLLVVGIVPRLLNLAIEPDKVYPLYGIHYFLHRTIARLTNVKIFTYLFGDSSSIVYYLRYIGYNLGKVEQTGSNFGTGVVHESPYLSSVGSGTVVADGLSINNADYSSTSFRVSQTTIGAHNFLGNHIAYPSQGKTGDNCLLGTKVMVPIDGKVREGVGLLGSPSFEIPRSVLRDTSLELESTERRRRLAAKNMHNLGTFALALLVRWMHVYALTMLAMLVADLYRRFGLASARCAVCRLHAVHAGVLHLRGTRLDGLSAAAPPVLLDLRSLLLVARTLLEAFSSGVAQAVHRHTIQDHPVAAARSSDGQESLRRRLRPSGEDPRNHRRLLHAQRGQHHPVPLAGGRRLQVRLHHDRIRLHRRSRRLGPLRRDDGGRRRARS